MPSFAFLAKKSRKKESGSSIVLSEKLRYSLIVPLVFLFDRLTKLFISSRYPEGESFFVLRPVLSLTRVNNTGAAFGVMKGGVSLLVWLTLVSILFLSCYLALRWQSVARFGRIGWLLVIGGAFGNLYDRLWLGYVIDFIDFRVWPVFNFADTAVCLGVALVFIEMLRR